MEESQDKKGGSDRSLTGDGGSHDSFKSTKTSFSSDQEATSSPNVPQKDDTNTIGSLLPEKGVVRRQSCKRRRNDETGPSDELKHKFPKSFEGASPRSLLPKRRVVRRHYRSTLVDSFIKKRRRNDETGPSVEPKPKFPKSFVGVSPRMEESKDDTGGSHSEFVFVKGHESIFEDSKKSVAHPVNDGVFSSSSDTEISPSTSVDHITGALSSPERPSSSLSKIGGHRTGGSGPSGSKKFMSWQWSTENSPVSQTKPEAVISERYHVLSIEDRESPRRTSFDSSLRITAGGYEFARDYRPPRKVRVEPPPVIVGHVHEPPPVISWVEEFGMIAVGVYLFCSTALLSTAYALNEGGWIALSIYVVFLFATLFTADIIPLCFVDVSASRTYLDLGSLAFGLPGRLIVLAFVCMFSYATCIDCVMINREHFTVLWPAEDTLLTIMSIVIPTIFVCFCSLNEYRPLWNGIGVFLSVIVVIILVFLGALDVGFHVKETSVFHSSTTHLSIGFFSFCLCGHSVLPLVYSRVRNRKKYRKILIIIFSISTTLYVGTGCFGYAMFGKETKSLFTLNLPRHLFVSQLAMGITVTNHMLRYILNITPLAQNLEGLLPENYRNLRCRMLIRSVLAATTSLAFLGKGHYGLVVSLMGSIVGVAISLIIPTVCFLSISWNNLPRLRGWLCCSAILVGAFAMIIVIIRSSMSFPKG
ncbi:amino acid transporter AVT1C-like protein, partial [Tanacetum coccineum]